MRSTLLALAQFLGLVMLADFLAGVVHWLEDAYGTEDTPVVGPLVIRPNIVHHHFPRFFTRLTWWESSWELALLGAATVGAAWWLGALSWQLWVFVAISVNANQVHKWSHRTRAENGPVISFFQDIRVLQTHQSRESAARAHPVLAALGGRDRAHHRAAPSRRHLQPRPGPRPRVARRVPPRARGRSRGPGEDLRLLALSRDVRSPHRRDAKTIKISPTASPRSRRPSSHQTPAPTSPRRESPPCCR